MTYESDLEKRIEYLESLWDDEMKVFVQVAKMLEGVESEIKNHNTTIQNLQDPNSTCNKHGPECYKLTKEKLEMKFENISRQIRATIHGLNHYINANKR